MSATLFFLLPIGMLIVVWSFCFVGCGYPDFMFDSYSDLVLGETNLLAYWPLNELLQSVSTPGPAGTAGDLSKKGHDGTYTIPPPYPSGLQAVAQSAVLNPPNLARGTSLVPGDANSASNKFAASAAFGGGYVSIPWSTQDWPLLNQFSFEAWVLPKWTGTGNLWVVFSAFINNTGFRVLINDQNHWEFVIGTGPGNMAAAIDTMVPIDPTSSTPTYVAVTCDSTTGMINLWINPQGQGDTPNPPPPPATWTSPMPTGYVAADLSQLTAAFIGAGANDQPLRTPTTNPQGAPLYPFQGLIQSVALYGGLVDPSDSQSHFASGAG